MRNVILTLCVAACGYERVDSGADTDTDAEKPDKEPIEATGPDGDSNEDGLEDVYQKFGFGYDASGNPYWVWFDSAGLPPVETMLGLVGHGGWVYDPNAENWRESWVTLVPYMVNGVRMGWAFTNMRDSEYEVQVVDVGTFEPDGGEGWGDYRLDPGLWDDPRYIVYHVDFQGCANEQTAVHFLWQVQEGFVKPLTQGIAPPAPSCN